ncbi:MAG: glycosyltransferase [Bacteroidia bacterium]
MKRILIAPLDWGLGHATRCIPLIRLVEELGMQPVLAGEGRSALLLQQEFPHLEFIPLPGYRVSYPAKGSMALHMALAIPSILKSIRKEHIVLENIIREKQLDAVISDNRYGLYSKQVPCIFITHQIYIQTPFGSSLLHRMNERFISRFRECWIPDTEGPDNLSGELSHGKGSHGNRYFIGPLSRFRKQKASAGSGYNLVVILSGPEPQRSVLEQKVRKELEGFQGRALMVLGRTEEETEEHQGKMDIYSHLGANALEQALSEAELVLCRSGYSGMMDAAVLGCKCIVVPTPGQTEQEYLSRYHTSLENVLGKEQAAFDLKKALEEAKNLRGFKIRIPDDSLLRERLKKLSGLA